MTRRWLDDANDTGLPGILGYWFVGVPVVWAGLILATYALALAAHLLARLV